MLHLAAVVILVSIFFSSKDNSDTVESVSCFMLLLLIASLSTKRQRLFLSVFLFDLHLIGLGGTCSTEVGKTRLAKMYKENLMAECSGLSGIYPS